MATAALLNCVERAGKFPTAEQAMVTMMYNKVTKDGSCKPGKRPIAHYRGLYRKWGRARKDLLSKWEKPAPL